MKTLIFKGALLGKSRGEKVDIEVPAGTIHYEVLDIKKPV